MDTTSLANTISWRAITNQHLHQFIFGCIVLWQTLTALVCWVGVYRLVKKIKQADAAFNAAKSIAQLGLFLGFSLYMFGFIIVAGELFLYVAIDDVLQFSNESRDVYWFYYVYDDLYQSLILL